MRLLVIEDHRAMRDLIANYFRDRGFAVDAVGRGEDALAAVAAVAYDAVIIDLGLPDMDGIEVLRRLRSERGAQLPALIVTARDGVGDRIGGLDAGADDYVLKPFDIAELEARIRAVLRRPGSRKELFRSYGDVRFDPTSRTASVADTPLDLTRREAAVLETLVSASGRTVVKDALEDQLYGFDQSVSGNALEAPYHGYGASSRRPDRTSESKPYVGLAIGFALERR